MAGGTALGGSAKSGIWDGVDADITTEAVPNAERKKQMTIVLERRKEIRCPAAPAGDCEISVVGSMQPSLCPPVYDNSGESKGDAFPWHGIPRAKGPDLLQYQAILRLAKIDLQVTGRKTLQQRAKVEGAAYAETVRMIDRFCCDVAEYLILCALRSPSAEVIRSFEDLDGNFVIISPQTLLASAPVGVTIQQRQAHNAANLQNSTRTGWHNWWLHFCMIQRIVRMR
jgi:hypothetical protein